TVAFGKPAASSLQGSTLPAKDRPGFFRRVFGSSKYHTQHETFPPQQHAMEPNSSSNEKLQKERPSSKQHIVYQMKTNPSSRLPSRDVSSAGKDVPPSLNKKSSGFFRRRKKSVSEVIPPPVLPLQLQSTRLAD